MKPITTLTILLGTCLIAGAEGRPDRAGGSGGPVRPDNRVRPMDPSPEMLKKFDADGDGKLSEAERAKMRETIEQQHKEKLKQFDTDGDGQLSEAERAKMREAYQGEWLKKFDADGDGKLSEEERRAMPKPPNGPHGPHDKGPGERRRPEGGGSAPRPATPPNVE